MVKINMYGFLLSMYMYSLVYKNIQVRLKKGQTFVPKRGRVIKNLYSQIDGHKCLHIFQYKSKYML